MSEYPGRHFSLSRQRLPDGRALISVRGSVDLFAAPELKRRLLEAVDGGAEEVIVDLSETDFLDSTGLGALLGAYKRLSRRGGRLVVVPGTASVMRVFEITGLDAILSFAGSRDEALAGAGAPA
jgi:anti-sigma B factor antagonist